MNLRSIGIGDVFSSLRSLNQARLFDHGNGKLPTWLRNIGTVVVQYQARISTDPAYAAAVTTATALSSVASYTFTGLLTQIMRPISPAKNSKP